jgi:hypothetical protein
MRPPFMRAKINLLPSFRRRPPSAGQPKLSLWRGLPDEFPFRFAESDSGLDRRARSALQVYCGVSTLAPTSIYMQELRIHAARAHEAAWVHFKMGPRVSRIAGILTGRRPLVVMKKSQLSTNTEHWPLDRLVPYEYTVRTHSSERGAPAGKGEAALLDALAICSSGGAADALHFSTAAAGQEVAP